MKEKEYADIDEKNYLITRLQFGGELLLTPLSNGELREKWTKIIHKKYAHLDGKMIFVLDGMRNRVICINPETLKMTYSTCSPDDKFDNNNDVGQALALAKNLGIRIPDYFYKN